MSKHTETLRQALAGQASAAHPYMPFGSVKTSDLAALLAERDALLAALQHMQWCSTCAEGPWTDCGDGRAALAAIHDATEG